MSTNRRRVDGVAAAGVGAASQWARCSEVRSINECDNGNQLKKACVYEKPCDKPELYLLDGRGRSLVRRHYSAARSLRKPHTTCAEPRERGQHVHRRV